MQVEKEVVSVSEMARILGLSRGRFYQLMSEGVFPQPIREDENIRRTHFDRELQEQCITVRKTNQGMNGKVILFYARAVSMTQTVRSSRIQSTPRSPNRQTTITTRETNALLRELRSELEQLGVTVSSIQQIEQALTRAFPDGHSGVERGVLLRRIFAEINCRNSPDNLAR